MPDHDQLDYLREKVSQALKVNLQELDWDIVGLLPSTSLRIDVFLQQDEDATSLVGDTSSVDPILSETINLAEYMTPSESTYMVESPAKTPCSNFISQSSGTPPQTHQTLPQQCNPPASQKDDETSQTPKGKRKGISGLRPARVVGNSLTLRGSNSKRQITLTGNFPKRLKVQSDADISIHKQDAFDNFVVGIWGHIHGGINLEPESLLEQWQITTRAVTSTVDTAGVIISLGQSDFGHNPAPVTSQNMATFNSSNIFCRKITQASRACRALEVIVQARWIEHFDAHIELLALTIPALSPTKRRKAALLEACSDFGWSEKELRNKMAIWRGYKEIKDAAGWAALVFAGIGLYRFCKYRVGLTPESLGQLRVLRPRIEVAADTLHPTWRKLLMIIGESPQRHFYGHPHDWVVFRDGSDPVPLRTTYLEYDPLFSFEHIRDSIVDVNAWEPGDDPRWIPPVSAVVSLRGQHLCRSCGQEQSEDPTINSCYCFPSHFGTERSPCPVQVYRTTDGRGNGLLALCHFERGTVIGEFVGLVTKGMESLDVLKASTGARAHQTWQGRQGNFTRFINHSCKANAQFQEFIWRNTQRIMLVSKGISAGLEITVDYSDSYWQGLEKDCLCGETCCRYKSMTCS